MFDELSHPQYRFVSFIIHNLAQYKCLKSSHLSNSSVVDDHPCKQRTKMCTYPNVPVKLTSSSTKPRPLYNGKKMEEKRKHYLQIRSSLKPPWVYELGRRMLQSPLFARDTVYFVMHYTNSSL